MVDLRREIDPKRECILCNICKGPIYRADSENYGDDYYHLDGKNICDECISGYLKENRRELQ